jgi:hypothetical protein
MTMGWIDAFRSRGHVIGFVPEAYTLRNCSRPSCEGTRAFNCLQTKLLVHGRSADGDPTVRRRNLWELSCCTACGTIYGRDFNGSRSIHQRAMSRAFGGAGADVSIDEDEVEGPPNHE